jgi:hypothetical protein
MRGQSDNWAVDRHARFEDDSDSAGWIAPGDSEVLRSVESGTRCAREWKEEVLMNNDPIRGKTIRFSFSDGPMAKKTFEHHFDRNGTVSFRMVGSEASSSVGKSASRDDSKKTPDPKFEIAMIREDLGAVSYLGSGGYTLTTLLDFKTRKLVAFSSNEKGVSVQHGTFEYAELGASPRGSTAHASQ